MIIIVKKLNNLLSFGQSNYQPHDEVLASLEGLLPMDANTLPADIHRKDQVQGTDAARYLTTVFPDSDFFIEEHDDFFRMGPLFLWDAKYVVDWNKKLLFHSAHNSQSSWVNLTKDEDLKLPSMMLYAIALRDLFENKDDSRYSAVIQNFISEFRMLHFGGRMTSARIYSDLSPAIYVHNYGYSNSLQGFVNAPVAVLNDYATSNKFPPLLISHLFGDISRKEIDPVFEWAFGALPYIKSNNPASGNPSVRPVLIGERHSTRPGNKEAVLIDYSYSETASAPALGVRYHKLEDKNG